MELKKPCIKYGSKSQVYKGIAEMTTGKLTKKDIVSVTVNGVTRYKSKRQVASSKRNESKWAKAHSQAIAEMNDLLKNTSKKDYYKDNILLFKPGKKYKNYSITQIKMGKKLYKKTMEIYREMKSGKIKLSNSK